MVQEKEGLIGRLRGAFRPDVVAPEKEFVRRSAEEDQEQEDADEAVGREARS